MHMRIRQMLGAAGAASTLTLVSLAWTGQAGAVAVPVQVRPAAFTASGTLSGVAAISATSAWAVGLAYEKTASTLIVRWNGRAWKRVPSPSPASHSFLSSVASTSATNAWAVGGTNLSGAPAGKTLIVRWTGRAWKQVPVPAADAHGKLLGVTATSAHNAWAVGSTALGKSLILHWNGSTWKRVSSPPAVNSELLAVTATSARNAWAVGFTSHGTLILHWNGTAWRRVPGPVGGPVGELSRCSRHLSFQCLGSGIRRRTRADLALERPGLEAGIRPGRRRQPLARRGRNLPAKRLGCGPGHLGPDRGLSLERQGMEAPADPESHP